jgi:hypothetical protein
VRVVNDAKAAEQVATEQAATTAAREESAAVTKEDALAAIKTQEKFYNDIFMAQGAPTWDEASDAIVAKLGKNFDYQPIYDALDIKPSTIDLIENREGNAPSFAVRRMLEEYHTFLGGTSTGSPFQVFLQEVARQEFGLTDVAALRAGDLLPEAMRQYGDALPEFQHVLRTMYANTQDWFQERGITEVTLFRGESWPEALKPGGLTFDGAMHNQDVLLKPLSSWSTNLASASDFAQRAPGTAFGAIERATIPVDQILSVPGTGFGANYLDEMLVLGKTTGADVLAIDTATGQLAKDTVYDAFAEAAAKDSAAVTTTAESPEVQQMRSDRAALQDQRDAIQAKQDVLSAKWAKLVRETDFTEEDEAATAEKKLAAIEKQQGNNIKRMDKLDAKMAKLDAKLPQAVPQAAEIPPEAAAAAPAVGAALTYTLPEIDQQVESALIQQVQDAIPDAGVASHTDAIDIGATIDSYLQDRIGPLQGYMDDLTAIYAHSGDLTGEQIAWRAGDLSQHGGLTTDEVMAQYQAARRDETVRLLGQVRDVGGSDLEVADGAPAVLEDAIRQAQDVFPTEWLDASNDDGAVKLVTEQTRRGYYRADINGGDGTLGLRANAGTTPDDLYTAAVHELGHRMEASVDGVWQMEQDFYDARTAGDAWKALDPSLRVVGRTKVDKWINEYLGLDPKTIVRAGGLDPIQHYELLSSGLEWLLGADPAGAYWLSKDPEFLQFIYGILFGTRGG